MPQDEPDTHNFSTSSEHRLPAISGAQALQEEIRRARGIPSSLPGLDACLSPHNSPVASNGIRRGYVTELYGPPGSGKTTFAIGVAVNAIHDLGKAVWISAGSPLMQSRVHEINSAFALSYSNEPPSSPPETADSDNLLEDKFIYKHMQSLPRLLVMLMHPTELFPPPNTATLILDGLPNAISSAFPRQIRNKDTASSILQQHAAKRATSKRFQMIENLASALSRLAASRHIAVIILNNTTTSMKGGQRALLKPALGGQSWDAAVNTRIVLYRDLYPRQHQKQLTIKEKRGYRLAEVVRLGAKNIVRHPIPFVIETAGLRELELYNGAPATTAAPILPMVPDPEEDDGHHDGHHDDHQLLFQIRTSQPDAPPIPPPTAHAAFPTASQLFREEQAAAEAGSAPLPLPNTTITEPQFGEPAAPDTRPSKRKALEIADSEDENDEEDGPATMMATTPPKAAPPQPAITAGAGDAPTTEQMLFDVHERRPHMNAA